MTAMNRTENITHADVKVSDFSVKPTGSVFSWYSWSVHSLVNGVYAFGFLFMLPQLFINYRLKSVAHLPWRAFMYKVRFPSKMY